jgi:hypothetical protein
MAVGDFEPRGPVRARESGPHGSRRGGAQAAPCRPVSGPIIRGRCRTCVTSKPIRAEHAQGRIRISSITRASAVGFDSGSVNGRMAPQPGWPSAITVCALAIPPRRRRGVRRSAARCPTGAPKWANPAQQKLSDGRNPRYQPLICETSGPSPAVGRAADKAHRLLH